MSNRADKRRAKKKHKRAVERARALAADASLILPPEEHIERHAEAMRRRLKATQALILKGAKGARCCS